MPASPAPTFLWHDYETFGADTRHDRPAEFACLRTDERFEPVDEPVVLRCRPTLDYLPEPAACAITGIGPESCWRDGLPEPPFARQVNAQMLQPGSCVVGFNSMRFDDEITRHLFWRNFIDPYEREWANGNSRFDLIDLSRAACALRPQGLQWPLREDGHWSFRLTDLSAANALPHARAHSALSDVEATLALARKLRAAQPRLFEHALSLRAKARALELLDWRTRKPLVHVSQRFPAERGCLAVVVPIALHPAQAGKVIVVDAFHDPARLLEWPAERIATTLVAPADAANKVPLGIKVVHANRAPFLAPVAVLKDVDLGRIRLDRERIDDHVERLRGDADLAAKLQQVQRLLDSQSRPPADPDGALYDGFIGAEDKRLGQRFVQANPGERRDLARGFRDARLQALAQRFRWRHDSDTLDATERALWLDHCRHALQRPGRALADYTMAVDGLEASQSPALVVELRAWAARVRTHARLPEAPEV